VEEWAQLKGGPPQSRGLERGHWYPVETRTKDGLVRVLGPGAVGVMVDMPSVRIVNRQPDMITRIQGTPIRSIISGQPTPMLFYYGVCPKGHHIQPLTLADSKVECPKCNQTYHVEDEELS
jgi:hypothetical protein